MAEVVELRELNEILDDLIKNQDDPEKIKAITDELYITVLDNNNEKKVRRFDKEEIRSAFFNLSYKNLFKNDKIKNINALVNSFKSFTSDETIDFNKLVGLSDKFELSSLKPMTAKEFNAKFKSTKGETLETFIERMLNFTNGLAVSFSHINEKKVKELTKKYNLVNNLYVKYLKTLSEKELITKLGPVGAGEFKKDGTIKGKYNNFGNFYELIGKGDPTNDATELLAKIDKDTKFTEKLVDIKNASAAYELLFKDLMSRDTKVEVERLDNFYKAYLANILTVDDTYQNFVDEDKNIKSELEKELKEYLGKNPTEIISGSKTTKTMASIVKDIANFLLVTRVEELGKEISQVKILNQKYKNHKKIIEDHEIFRDSIEKQVSRLEKELGLETNTTFKDVENFISARFNDKRFTRIDGRRASHQWVKNNVITGSNITISEDEHYQELVKLQNQYVENITKNIGNFIDENKGKQLEDKDIAILVYGNGKDKVGIIDEINDYNTNSVPIYEEIEHSTWQRDLYRLENRNSVSEDDREEIVTPIVITEEIPEEEEEVEEVVEDPVEPVVEEPVEETPSVMKSGNYYNKKEGWFKRTLKKFGRNFGWVLLGALGIAGLTAGTGASLLILGGVGLLSMAGWVTSFISEKYRGFVANGRSEVKLRKLQKLGKQVQIQEERMMKEVEKMPNATSNELTLHQRKFYKDLQTLRKRQKTAEKHIEYIRQKSDYDIEQNFDESRGLAEEYFNEVKDMVNFIDEHGEFIYTTQGRKFRKTLKKNIILRKAKLQIKDKEEKGEIIVDPVSGVDTITGKKITKIEQEVGKTIKKEIKPDIENEEINTYLTTLRNKHRKVVAKKDNFNTNENDDFTFGFGEGK